MHVLIFIGEKNPNSVWWPNKSIHKFWILHLFAYFAFLEFLEHVFELYTFLTQKIDSWKIFVWGTTFSEIIEILLVYLQIDVCEMPKVKTSNTNRVKNYIFEHEEIQFFRKELNYFIDSKKWLMMCGKLFISQDLYGIRLHN